MTFLECYHQNIYLSSQNHKIFHDFNVELLQINLACVGLPESWLKWNLYDVTWIGKNALNSSWIELEKIESNQIEKQ